ncbi:Histone-lysine N-methyltransferase SETMAR [Habropoda laboriosa]|uniref:Histone-lysine N-methyltransferase SETMAR n=1 Tax=Habropoda laboriosa TaxID=597456 RepID=A0A0L7QYX5_9HYME|nr:Histone-lysine N-methyltransferase SETMAR [Habropoda laboriosa]
MLEQALGLALFHDPQTDRSAPSSSPNDAPKAGSGKDPPMYSRDVDLASWKPPTLCEGFVEAREGRQALINRKNRTFLYDNVRPYIASITVQKLHQLGIEVLPHCPYSTNLSPADFHFFTLT